MHHLCRAARLAGAETTYTQLESITTDLAGFPDVEFFQITVSRRFPSPLKSACLAVLLCSRAMRPGAPLMCPASQIAEAELCRVVTHDANACAS